MWQTNISSRTFGSKSVSKKAQSSIHPWFTKTQVADVLAKSRSISYLALMHTEPFFMTGGCSSPRMTKKSYASGSLPRYLTRKLVDVLETVCTNNFATSYATSFFRLCIPFCLIPRFQVGEPEYAWVSRHTWQSWRERYKKNAERLDKVIGRIVEQKMPQRGEKGQYGYVRQPEERTRKVRKKKSKAIDQPSTPDECSNEIVNMLGGASHLHPAMDPGMGVRPLHIASLQQLATTGNPYPGVIAPPPGPTGNPDAGSTEEELEDDGTDWAVRIGDAPPPMWGKRTSPDERDEDEDVIYHKRPRVDK